MRRTPGPSISRHISLKRKLHVARRCTLQLTDGGRTDWCEMLLLLLPARNYRFAITATIQLQLQLQLFLLLLQFSHLCRCMCPAGYTGKDCDTKYKPCSPSPCQNGGICRASGLTYDCKCPRGKCLLIVSLTRSI